MMKEIDNFFLEKINKLKERFVLKILAVVKTDFQLRIVTTTIEIVLWLLPISRFFILAFLHGLTVIIAYQKLGLESAIITALIPVLSQIYWLLFLLLNSHYLVFIQFFALLSIGVILCRTLKLITPMRFTTSFTIYEIFGIKKERT
jgi:hypothetical protein